MYNMQAAGTGSIPVFSEVNNFIAANWALSTLISAWMSWAVYHIVTELAKKGVVLMSAAIFSLLLVAYGRTSVKVARVIDTPRSSNF